MSPLQRSILLRSKAPMSPDRHSTSTAEWQWSERVAKQIADPGKHIRELQRCWSSQLKYGTRNGWTMWWGRSNSPDSGVSPAVDHDDAASGDCRIAGPAEPIKRRTRFGKMNDIGELVMAFEEEFGCEIPDDAAETILTVGDAVKFLEKNAKS